MKEYKPSNSEQEQTFRLNDAEVVYALMNNQVDSESLRTLKEETGVSGELLSGWLHVTPKTLRSYLARKSVLSETLGEQVLLLKTLFKHGASVFGSSKEFEAWLDRENLMLDRMKPKDFLGTISGIRFIDSSLYGMEYGDNA
ncbi:MAG TPA: MbcA/ParS/Xre antitoxin family protein [Bacteroidales bacterium]|nr:MbcA/ParS/Xre antitoxin family protein [Bacteroidales bacterium]